MGEIVSAHALGGAVRVRAYQPPAPSLVPGRRVILEHGGARRTIVIQDARPHARNLVVLELEGVADRNAAEALRGARVLVPRSDLPPAEADEFYWHELEGFRVETDDGRLLGTIAETLHTGTSDVWAVRGTGREYLIPVIADVVRTIDHTARRVEITPLPGLLD